MDRVRKRRKRAVARGFDASIVLIGHPLGASTPSKSPLLKTPMLAGLSRKRAQVVATRVASPWASPSIAAGTSAAVCEPGDTAHCTSMKPLIVTFTGSGTSGTLTFTVSGFCSYFCTSSRNVAPMSP